MTIIPLTTNKRQRKTYFRGGKERDSCMEQLEAIDLVLRKLWKSTGAFVSKMFRSEVVHVTDINFRAQRYPL